MYILIVIICFKLFTIASSFNLLLYIFHTLIVCENEWIYLKTIQKDFKRRFTNHNTISSIFQEINGNTFLSLIFQVSSHPFFCFFHWAFLWMCSFLMVFMGLVQSLFTKMLLILSYLRFFFAVCAVFFFMFNYLWLHPLGT